MGVDMLATMGRWKKGGWSKKLGCQKKGVVKKQERGKSRGGGGGLNKRDGVVGMINKGGQKNDNSGDKINVGIWCRLSENRKGVDHAGGGGQKTGKV